RFPAAEDIREAMDSVRDASSVANALRKKEKLRVRLPLAKLTVVVAGSAGLAQFDDILRDELNVKAVELDELTGDTAERYGISHRLTVNARAIGPRLGKQVQQVIKASKSGDWSEQNGVVTAGGIELVEGEYELALDTSGRPAGEAIATLPGGGFVILDTETTPALEAEGLARDMIRAVQDTRKQADFDVSDRIHLQLDFASDADRAAVEQAWEIAGVATETLATSSTIGEGTEGAEFVNVVNAGTYANAGDVTIAVTRQEIK